MIEAGYPAGVFSLVNGDKDTVAALIDHPGIKAVAFVGSTPVAKQIYSRATSLGKRALALGGAKNYLIVAPDADEGVTVKGVVDSFTGCAGQRCMAASLMIAVGKVDHLIRKIVAHASELELGKTMGAIIDKAALDRITAAIAKAEQQGAKVLLDGRMAKVPSAYPQGNWIGPTILDQVKPDMDCAKQEIFGPVLSIIHKQSLPEALCLEHGNPYGNATSIFTTSGAAAKYVSEAASAGMIGINIGVPVPREPFSFGGTKESKFGQGDITGHSSLDFWTNLKKITTKWNQQADATWMS
jgi:malonate-semialdehyde dehydrogenase (acetylating)/methylmalonate-semialdehyde dehydrogenase